MNDRPTPPDDAEVELSITFFYYRDLDAALRFYDEVMGFELAIDQGWSKIYRIRGAAHLGLVDEAMGMHRSAPEKPVQLCIRVRDVDAWYAHAKARKLEGISDPFENHALGIRAVGSHDYGPLV